MSKITLPYNYEPRDYQLPLLNAMDSGIKRAVIVWHRRSGKDKTCLNLTIKKMFERVGSYYYVFPTYNQGRKVLWDGIDRDGFRYISHFPQEILASKPNDTEMKVKTINGSLFQVVGSDNIDAIVGTNPIGVVMSEYSLQDPRAWDYLRPILAENGGWAIFVFTPRGENHGYDIYILAKNDPSWFCELLTAEETQAIPSDILRKERTEIIHKDGNDALYQQEYMCNFTVPIAGAYYADQIIQAYNERRISKVPYEKEFPVDTWWDLGINDTMSVWFTQSIGAELRVIDYYENTGQGFLHYIEKLKNKGYIYGTHTAPHDIKVRELSSGKSRLDAASNLGIDFAVGPKLSIIDGIDSVRRILSKCWFDEDKCRIGLNALKNYRKQYDDTRKCYLNQPYHDWSSNAADAFRTLALGIDTTISIKPKAYQKHNKASYQFNPMTC